MPPVSSLLQPLLAFGQLLGTSSPDAGSQQVLGTSEPATHQSKGQQRKLRGRFLHITDFHPDEFYQVHSSTEEDIACHRGDGIAGTYGAETSDCDSPYSLVNATFAWVEEHLKDKVDFVIWTGDSARHDSDERHPRTTNQVLGDNRKVANQFVETFSDSTGALSVPIVPTFGNNDFLPHNIFYPGPNKWLHAYSDIWKRFIPEEQRHSFEFGGWFYVEPIPNKLAVFSLNTMYFFDRNAGVDGCADPSEPGFKHMEWLRVQLQRLRERGMKAILTGHVPPARTSSKQNWDETCWQKYTLWLKQYRDVVAGAVYGHMNIDHFLLQDTKEIDALLGADRVKSRQSLDEETSAQSKGDYLQELRDEWSDLPGSVVRALIEQDEDEDEDDAQTQDLESSGKKHKKKKDKKRKKKQKGKKDDLKKIGGKYAERYQLSLISPSVVPNYLPTLRVIEYNITGLEESAVWADSFDTSQQEVELDFEKILGDAEEDRKELKRDIAIDREYTTSKKPKSDKPKGPPKHSLPGPAYYPQPLTFTGYTQYFANLTYINNDVHDPENDGVQDEGWREGEHKDKKPKHKVPQPRRFSFEVEYSTFEDKFYKLPDLTVKNFLKLAYRVGQSVKSSRQSSYVLEKDDDLDGTAVDEGDDVDHDEHDTEVYEDSEDDEEEIRASGKKHKKHKKKKKKTKKRKTWLHFLDRAFVGTMSKKELKDY